MKKSDAILFLIGGVLLLAWAYFEYSHGKALGFSRGASRFIDRGESAFIFVVYIKAIIGAVGILGFLFGILKK